MHELRSGELAHFKLVPHTPYYGTADATSSTSSCCMQPGCRREMQTLLERHLPQRRGASPGSTGMAIATVTVFRNTRPGLPWGMRTRAGKTRAKPWSMSMVRWSRARRHYVSYRATSTTRGFAWRYLQHLGKPIAPMNCAKGRRPSCYRFNEAFWDEAAGFYAFALDGDKKKVMSVASNPGHCLWSGIVPTERAARVVARLMAPDMRSGWGIRTLSANHPAFNPYSYQNGSVWPHDNGLIALGFRRYGFAARRRCWLAKSAVPAVSSIDTKCPSSMPGYSAAAQIFPCNFWEQTSRKRGQPALRLHSCKRYSVSSLTHPTTSFTSIPRSRTGFET